MEMELNYVNRDSNLHLFILIRGSGFGQIDSHPITAKLKMDVGYNS